MKQKRVGIIFGGNTSEHEVSLQSAKNIIDAIDRSKFDVVLIGISKEGKWNIYEESSYILNNDDPKRIQLNDPKQAVSIVPGKGKLQLTDSENGVALEEVDVVFPVLHGGIGEDGSLQGLMRIADIPFVGPSVLSSSMCMDKDIAKRLLKAAGIKVAEGFVFTRVDKEQINFDTIKETLGLPLFIKPASQGSSVGVSKVNTAEEFSQAIALSFQYDHKILVEETLNGREIECAVLGNENPEASAPGEIIAQTEFYSYESKYIDETGAKLKIPAELSDGTAEEIKKEAIRVFKVLECEGLARVDFFLLDKGAIYVNEVNTLPGFTQISMYPKLWEQSGLPYAELINKLIELALERYEINQTLL
jgi:D-alanine-D-alanine ligase